MPLRKMSYLSFELRQKKAFAGVCVYVCACVCVCVCVRACVCVCVWVVYGWVKYMSRQGQSWDLLHCFVEGVEFIS